VSDPSRSDGGAVAPFDATAPLRDGTVLLEASAGTGKTYTITSLALRLVAEQGIDLERILIVTFTRAAAAELRGRVRSRLVAAAAALEHALAQGWSAVPDGFPDDEVVRHLIVDGLEQGGDELARRAQRLRGAMQAFDDATIDTIHGFCQRSLQRAVPDVDVEPGAQLTDDVGELLDDLVHDVLIRELRSADPAWFRFVQDAGIGTDRLLAIARKLEGEPDLRVLPDPADLLEGDPHGLWDTAVERFRAAWAVEADELVEWLVEHASKGFTGTYYNRKRPAREAEAITAWCAASPHRIGDLSAVDKQLAYVARSTMTGKLQDPAALPTHLGVIDAADTLLAVPAQLATGLLLRFAEQLHDELPRRKAALGVLSFTDLLVALDRALATEESRDAVRAGIRSRFDVALIDEFQDTDPVQWRIFERVFGIGARLQLIGDPKQAIYGFRGADVHTYLAAKAQVPSDARFTLPTNHRSDRRYLDALEQLFARDHVFGPDGVFAVDDIDFVRVRAATANDADRLRFDDGPRPTLELRYVPRTLHADPDGEVDDRAVLPVGWARPFLARTVAHEIVAFLQEQPSIRSGQAWRTVVPRDIAVLVRTNEQAGRVQQELLDAGVPAVVGADDSVFGSPEATAVQRLLDALLQPSSDRLVRAALIGPILGRTAAELARHDGDDGSVEQLESWATTWRDQGTSAMLRRAMDEARTAARLLGQPRGERTLTNLTHLAELLHGAETAGRLGPEGAAAWLREQRHLDVPGAEDRQLRLESDDDAVTVVTVHRSKGLQYPVVWCPYLWEGRLLFGDDKHVLRFLDPDTGRLSLDLDTDVTGHSKQRHIALAEHDSWREQLRLLYVALTRAQHRCVVHTGPFKGVGTSPLQRLLYGADFTQDDGVPGKPSDPVGVCDEDLFATLRALESDDVGVTEVEPPAAEVRWDRPGGEPVALTVRTFDRTIDRSWQRTSFSRLTSGSIGHAGDGGELDVGPVGAPASGRDDGSPADDGRDHDHHVESVSDQPAARPAVQAVDPDASSEVTLARFPRGAEPGTFLHGLLEHLDFGVADDADAIGALVAERAPLANLAPLDDAGRATLVGGIREVLTTPLGPALGDVRLTDIPRADRLDELEFDLPLAGGYHGDGQALDLHRLADVFAAHAPDSTAPLAAVAQRLRTYPAIPARGFLTGSIDLVLRVPDHDVGQRYAIVDYKSNWLGGTLDPQRSVAGDYHPRRLADEMVTHDYVLQYHLYLVALHRLLRWRLGAAYDHDRHIAGACYLFLRGMTGPDTPRAQDGTPYGVYADRPTRGLIGDLDDLLRGAGS